MGNDVLIALPALLKQGLVNAEQPVSEIRNHPFIIRQPPLCGIRRAASGKNRFGKLPAQAGDALFHEFDDAVYIFGGYFKMGFKG